VQALARAREAGDLIEQADQLFFMADLEWQTGRLAEARAHIREAFELAVYADYRLCLMNVIEGAAYWCAATGQHAAALTLWAAEDAQRETLGMAGQPAENRRREQPLQEARQTLSAQQAQTAQERGTAMTLAAATEFAVMITGEPAPLPTLPGPDKLSSRERELITLVARGQTDAQIAEQLFISVSTVRTHLDRIRDKSGCRRRADLTRLALQEGII
jgi:DNA-binding NarL/FixJ family response regulator